MTSFSFGPPGLSLSVPFTEKVKLLYLSHFILTTFHPQTLLVLSIWKWALWALKQGHPHWPSQVWNIKYCQNAKYIWLEPTSGLRRLHLDQLQALNWLLSGGTVCAEGLERFFIYLYTQARDFKLMIDAGGWFVVLRAILCYFLILLVHTRGQCYIMYLVRVFIEFKYRTH